MARIGKHKAKYDKYRNSGNREKNKLLKKEKQERRLKRFAERKASGKSYVYSKEKVENKFIAACGRKELDAEDMEKLRNKVFAPNQNGKRGKDTPFARNTSKARKLENSLREKVEQEKKNKKQKTSTK